VLRRQVILVKVLLVIFIPLKAYLDAIKELRLFPSIKLLSLVKRVFQVYRFAKLKFVIQSRFFNLTLDDLLRVWIEALEVNVFFQSLFVVNLLVLELFAEQETVGLFISLVELLLLQQRIAQINFFLKNLISLLFSLHHVSFLVYRLSDRFFVEKNLREGLRAQALLWILVKLGSLLVDFLYKRNIGLSNLGFFCDLLEIVQVVLVQNWLALDSC